MAATGPTGPVLPDDAIVVVCEVKPNVHNRWIRRGLRAHRKLDAIRGTKMARKRWRPVVECVTHRKHDAVKRRVGQVERKLRDCRRSDLCYWRGQYRKLSAYDKWWVTELGECESHNDPSINTGNGFYGEVQWVLKTWRAAKRLMVAAGYRAGPKTPLRASIEEQRVTAVFWRGHSNPRTQWPGCYAKKGW